MDINNLLDFAKSLNLKNSDYQTAKLLGVDARKIYEWRSGRKKPTEEQVIGLAEIADLDPLQTLANFKAETAKSDKMSHFWREVSELKIAANQ